jgi:hypothetical protein
LGGGECASPDRRGGVRVMCADPVEVIVDEELMGLYAAKSAVYTAASLGLGSMATRLFLHMALECWDDDDNPAGQAPRRYFGRRESSAFALGFMAPDNGSEAAFRAVKRATRELVDRGAIVRVRPGGNGQTAEFELQVASAHFKKRFNDPIPLPFLHKQGTDFWSPQRATF